MAASKIAICNMALAELGSTIYVNDIDSPTTKEEKYCALFFDHALDYVLSLDSWACAIHDKSVSYNDPATLSVDDNWTYEYDLPADPYCVAPICILENPKGAKFVVKARALYTNVQYAGAISLQYIKRVTTITDVHPALVGPIFLMLAWYLAGPLAQGSKGKKQELWGMFELQLSLAKGTNGAIQQVDGMDTGIHPVPPDPESESWID